MLRHWQEQGESGPERAKQPFQLVKPAATRWSSRIASAQRLLVLRQSVQPIFPRKDEFWEKLDKIVLFLTPFKIATDTIQRDTSNLYDVWKEFNNIHAHVSQILEPDLQGASGDCVYILENEWKKHVNVDATAAAALFSFNQLEGTLKEPDHTKLSKWIAEWGSKYVCRFHRRDADRNKVKADLEMLAGAFATRTDPFTDADLVKSQCDSTRAAAERKPDLAYVWRTLCTEQKGNNTLGLVAVAILSLSPSEAAAERSFSAQSDVHSKDRNRLSHQMVEAEMKVKWNSRKISRLVLFEEEEDEMSDKEDTEKPEKKPRRR